MIARHYQSLDAKALDDLLQCNRSSDVRLDRDRIITVGRPADGVLVWRPGGIVHELRVGDGLGRRSKANVLVNFAIADSIARPFNLQEALFLTDSDDMARYAESIGAYEETGKRIFTLNIR